MKVEARIYVGFILLLGVVLSILGLVNFPQGFAEWPLWGALIVLTTVAQLSKVEAPNHVLFYATPVFLFAALLLLPWPLFVPVVIVPHLIEWANVRRLDSDYLRAWYLQPFNIAMHLAAGGVSSLVYHAVDGMRLSGGGALPPPVVVGAAAVSYVAVNHLVLGQALVLARGKSWRDVGLLDTETNTTHMILLVMGYVVAVLWQLSPWVIIPALSPLVLIYRALTIPQLKHNAEIDAKTGVFNARHFGSVYAAECARAQRLNRPLAFIMADLDFLRDINNTYGHLAGDAVLAGIGRLLKATVRDGDSVGRFGGEEFAIVMPETGLLDARMSAERLRMAIEAERFTVPSSPTPISVTMSLGVACYPSDATTPQDLIHSADAAVYVAKAEGRNRVACFSDAAKSTGVTPPTFVAPAAPVEPKPYAPVILTDYLTGLGSHRAFQEDLRHAVAQARLTGEDLTLARLDLDSFNLLNDAQGHGFGDAVLAEMATVLRQGRRNDRAYRLGGDDFALILPRANVTEARMVLDRLRLQAPTSLGGVTVSIGTASLITAPDADTLLGQADAALRAAKQHGRNQVTSYADADDSLAISSVAQIRALRQLLVDGEMRVAFQPIWDLASKRPIAYEALARPAASYGFSGPQEAFDVAERQGQAHLLDALCRKAILASACDLPSDALLFLNVSPSTLDRDLLAGSTLVDEVVAAGLSPERLVLEITERSVARPGVVGREAARLHQLGFRVALDDTGVGNAGLEMLSQVPVAFVKIDKEIVARAQSNTAARAVLAGIAAIARETGAYVIAEGIESTAMLDFVRHVGRRETTQPWDIHGVQGYLLGRPSEVIDSAVSNQGHEALASAA